VPGLSDYEFYFQTAEARGETASLFALRYGAGRGISPGLMISSAANVRPDRLELSPFPMGAYPLEVRDDGKSCKIPGKAFEISGARGKVPAALFSGFGIGRLGETGFLPGQKGSYRGSRGFIRRFCPPKTREWSSCGGQGHLESLGLRSMIEFLVVAGPSERHDRRWLQRHMTGFCT